MNENECYHCGKTFESGDDVVYCQFCGANYHASCYVKNGCVNPDCFDNDDNFKKMKVNLQEAEEEYFAEPKVTAEIEYVSTNNLNRKRYNTLISLCATILLAILSALFIGVSVLIGKGIFYWFLLIVGVLLAAITVLTMIITIIFYNLAVGVTITNKRVAVENPFKHEESIPLDLITQAKVRPGFIKTFTFNNASSKKHTVFFHSQSVEYYSTLNELIINRKSNQQ